MAQATPKRSVVILPGLGNNRNDYNIMQQQLEDDYGFCVETADVSRVDWYVFVWLLCTVDLKGSYTEH